MKRLIIFITIIFCVLASANSLQEVQKKILNIKNVLSHAQHQQLNLQQQLKITETTMGNITIQLQKTQQQLSQQQKQLQSLNHQEIHYQQQIQSQQHNLAQQLRAIYMLGQQQYLKLLLNQEDPTHLSRMVIYYHYINLQRITKIQQYNQTLQKLAQTRQQIEQQTQRLQILQNQQQQQHQQLTMNKQQRLQLLQTLNSQISNNQQQLTTLLANKLALEKIVSHFATRHTAIVEPVFSTRHGKLPWPTRGKIVQQFGTSIEHSQLKSTGVLIGAAEGQNVYAIAPGQVVFANWMAGYGLLLIIDHGNGFMSIYGRNNSIYKKAGEQVKAGELIATVGDTGGYEQSALYFALRRDGKPVNPEQWCG